MANSRVRVESITPPGDRVPGGEISTPSNAPFATASPAPITPIPGPPGPPGPPAVANTVSIVLRPTVGDVMKNVSGATATLVDLSTINPNFQGMAWSFPAAAGDENEEQWVVFPIPTAFANVPNLRARVHALVR